MATNPRLLSESNTFKALKESVSQDVLNLNNRMDTFDPRIVFESLADLKNAVADPKKPYTLVTTTGRVDYSYVEGNFAGKIDDVSIVRLIGTPVTQGALVRQNSLHISYQNRSVGDRLDDVVSVIDHGAKGDGVTQNKELFLEAVSALSVGGLFQIPGGTYKVGKQFIGPGWGNVHAYDYADIGDKNVITNSSFSGNPVTDWTLTNCTPANPGINHTLGTVGKAITKVPISSNTTYLITFAAITLTKGDIAFVLNGQNLFTGSEGTSLIEGTDSFELQIFSYETEGLVDFEINTCDGDWSGTLTNVKLIEVKREAPADIHGVAADAKNLNHTFQIKFGRFRSGNIAIGDRITLGLATYAAAWNVAIGARALATNTYQFENTAIGAFCLEYNQVDRNTAGGYSCFRYNTKGIQNTGWGYKAFGRNSVGSNNSGFGFWAALYNKTGGNNSCFGALSLYYSIRGGYNCSFGSQAGLNSGGDGNIYIGAITGPNTTGEYRFPYMYQTIVGTEATGYGLVTVVGARAKAGSDPRNGGTEITTSASVFGFQAYAAEYDTTVVGANATALKYRSTVVGANATSEGRDSVAVGFLSHTTENSTSIGSQTGINLFGFRNLSIGAGANSYGSPTNWNDTIAIGAGATVTGSDQAQIGGPNTDVYTNKPLQSRSDLRDKADVRPTKLGLPFILSLTPVDYRYDFRQDYQEDMPPPFGEPEPTLPVMPIAPVKPSDQLPKDGEIWSQYHIFKNSFDIDFANYKNFLIEYEIKHQAWLERAAAYQENVLDVWAANNKLENVEKDGSKKGNRYHHGLIAQDVEKLIADGVIEDFGGLQNHQIKGGLDVKTMGYIELIAPLIKAIHDLVDIQNDMKSDINYLKDEIANLKKN